MFKRSDNAAAEAKAKAAKPGKPVKKTKAAAPSTNPYLNARREWNERYSSFITSANNWRLIALISSSAALVLAGGLVAVSLQHKVVPYLVDRDASGTVTGVRRADEASKPGEKEIKAMLREWITGARTVYVDSNAQAAIVNKSYGLTLPDSAAYRTLAQYHKEHNPYQRAASETVEITVQPPMPLSNNTWQVQWHEVVKQRVTGKVLEDKNYQATVNIIFSAATTEEQLMANGYGVYVNQFSWSERF